MLKSFWLTFISYKLVKTLGSEDFQEEQIWNSQQFEWMVDMSGDRTVIGQMTLKSQEGKFICPRLLDMTSHWELSDSSSKATDTIDKTFCDQWIPLNSIWSFNERTRPKKITSQKRKSPTTGSGLTRPMLSASACVWLYNISKLHAVPIF